MIRLYWGTVVTLLVVILCSCFGSAEMDEPTQNNAIGAPILYENAEAIDGVAIDFINALTTGDYKAAFQLLNKENQSWYRSSDELKKRWNNMISSETVVVYDPGVLYGLGEGEASADLYCFPTSTDKERMLLLVEVLDEKVSLLGTALHFELAENLVVSLIKSSYDDIAILGKTDSVRERWEASISEVGQYQYTMPPYTKLTFDAESIYFPMQFEKQRLTVKISVAYQDGERVAALTVVPV